SSGSASACSTRRSPGRTTPTRTFVGLTGFEPATPAPPVQCATKLRHSPLFDHVTGIGDPDRPAVSIHGTPRRDGIGATSARSRHGHHVDHSQRKTFAAMADPTTVIAIIAINPVAE